MQKNKYYILDFFINEISVCFEVDGGVHRENESYDLRRDTHLIDDGISVYRITNEMVENKKYCKKFIRETFTHHISLVRIKLKNRFDEVLEKMAADIRLVGNGNIKKAIKRNMREYLKTYFKYHPFLVKHL